MSKPEFKSVTEAAAARLRTEILALPEGAFLGSEAAVRSKIAASRLTMRQVARILERDGLLRVRRGLNGGYFGARPSVGMIESIVSTYLEMLSAEQEDLTSVATALWVVSVRKAASLKSPEARDFARTLRKKVGDLPNSAAFDVLLAIEIESRDKLFALINSPYTQLIFQINIAFARRKSAQVPTRDDSSAEHLEFVVAWRNAKMMELDAIAIGDPEIAAMAAIMNRNLFHKRLEFSSTANFQIHGLDSREFTTGGVQEAQIALKSA